MEFLVLGPLEVRNGEHTVRLGAAKQRALLGVLLLHANETVSTARLVDELGGNTAGDRREARPGLRARAAEAARRRHRPDAGARLQTEGRGAGLDLAEFERLVEAARAAPLDSAIELRKSALALWRGPPLADVVLEGPERHNVGRLSELLLTTQIEQSDAELRLGHHVQVVRELEALVAEHPYQERAAGLLMLALYRSGRQTDALEVYRSVRGRLSDELGLEPSPELRELEAAILRQDDSLAAPTRLVSRRRRTRRPHRPLLPQRDHTGVGWQQRPRSSRSPPRHLPRSSSSFATTRTCRRSCELARGDRPRDERCGRGPSDGHTAGSRRRRGGFGLGRQSRRQVSYAGRCLGPRGRGTIPVAATPTALAVGREAVWVVNARLGTLYKVDPQFENVDSVEFGVRSIRDTGAGVDLGEGSVWAAYGDSTLARVDPETLAASASATAGAAPAALVVAYGAVWVANSGDDTVRRFSPRTYELGDVGSFTVCRAPTGIAAGAGSIWVSCADDDLVARLPADLSSGSSVQITVGDGPTAVAFGAGAVWVANETAGTVSRIDPATNDEVATIDVGNPPAGIAVHRGLVWVSVQKPLDEASSP